MQTTQQAIFDIPALIGLNIDEVRTALGKPVDTQIDPPVWLETDVWENTFVKNECVFLLVRFNPMDRVVDDWFIFETTAPDSLTNDYVDLLRMFNVADNDPRFSTIEPVRALADPSKFTGVKLIAK